MIRDMLFDLFGKKKKEKPPEYNTGPFSILVFTPSGSKWKVYGDGEYLGEFDFIQFYAWDCPFLINEAFTWINVTTEEEKPYYYEDYYRNAKSRILFIPAGAPIIEFKAGQGYRFWCEIKEDRLYFIVWEF